MDSKNLKFIFLIVVLILDYGHLRDSPVAGCLTSSDCSYGQYCDEYLCKREVAGQQDYPSYGRGEIPRRISSNEYYNSNYQEEFDNRDDIRLDQPDSSEWYAVESDYDRRKEGQNLGPFFPVEDLPSDRRVLDAESLPPVEVENWDKIGIGGKHSTNKESNRDEYKSLPYDYNSLKAPKHVRQKEDSGSKSAQSVGHRRDSSKNKNEFVGKSLKDSVGDNVDLASKKSEIMQSEDNVRSFPVDSEKKIPPVPLTSEIAPDHDNSGLQDNHMQTEKQASSEGRREEGKVMVKGKVKKVKADVVIDQGPNPEKTYKRVEDFFQSQRESSIVEVPNSVKKEEASKLYKDNFVPVKDDASDHVSKEQADSDNLKEGNIKLSMNQNVTAAQAKIVAAALQNALWNNAPYPMFTVTKVNNAEVKLKMAQTQYTLEEPRAVAERIKKEPSVKDEVARNSGVEIKAADYEDTPSKNVKSGPPKTSVETQQPKYFLITIIVVGCVTGVVLTAVAIYLMMRRHKETKGFKPVTLPGQEAAADYQELCRQLRATQGWDSAPVKTTPTQHGVEKEKGLGSGRAPKYSWSEEPVVPNMDISTGHVVLAYMEDHLNNKDRLNKEWEALKTYEAEPNSREVGKMEKNLRKNRYGDVLPYDHNRVLLKETASATGSDYINASYIMDHDPKNPSYIATQGPLAQTVSDFWQMVWEQGVVVIVNLTKLSDLGLPQCHRYWPEEQQPIVTYRIYEVHLVSEHIWCEDYLVRSFYLKNLQTSETRTVTQFHFLTWPDLNVPATPKPLLEFRRKVNKCFRGRASPVVVHCSGGVGRTGTYILIDMVLNKMMRGAKEIDIAATVEHLRDQRPSMVKTKAQFEFALTAVAEEVNAILQALAK